MHSSMYKTAEKCMAVQGCASPCKTPKDLMAV